MPGHELEHLVCRVVEKNVQQPLKRLPALWTCMIPNSLRIRKHPRKRKTPADGEVQDRDVTIRAVHCAEHVEVRG